MAGLLKIVFSKTLKRMSSYCVWCVVEDSNPRDASGYEALHVRESFQ